MIKPVETMTRIRLISGLILMAFVTTHLLNHMLALISLDAVAAGSQLFVALWRNMLMTVVLYGALLVHALLGLVNIYHRKILKIPLWEIMQVALGLLIPFWLVLHILSTRGLTEFHGVYDSYIFLFSGIWPGATFHHVVMLLLIWTHGCIGLHFWLRFRPWYPANLPWLLGLAIAFPLLALAGFFVGMREVRVLGEANPEWLAWLTETQNWPGSDAWQWVFDTKDWVLVIFAVMIGAVLALRGARFLFLRLRPQIKLIYPNSQIVTITPGMTVLEASRSADIPHVSVCGGRGRCSTCRIRVSDQPDKLPPLSIAERRVLRRIGADRNIRLACQLRPTQDLTVTPLVRDRERPSEDRRVAQANPRAGVERDVTVLFADMQALKVLAQGRSPDDTIYLLNEYLKALGTAIEANGGEVDNYLGDGVIGLFGAESTPEAGAKQALRAAKAIASALADLNHHMQADLKEPIKIGIGLHMGKAIVGDLGYGDVTRLTAIGEAVNIAAKLKTFSKKLDAQLVVSTRLTEEAAADLGPVDSRNVEIRGLRQPLSVHIVADAEALPIDDETADSAGKESEKTPEGESGLDDEMALALATPRPGTERRRR